MLTGSATRPQTTTRPPGSFLPPRDPAMKLVEESALQVAQSDETVLLLGETGVGKDVMARRIHEASPRSGHRLVSVNCAALPDGLLESELFGHVRGAYTGAVDSQPGLFEVAAGGTIFLDEIGELSPRLQAKLLHVLQEKRYCRVGGRQVVTADVRVIAATNQDLDRAIVEGTFRRDLYYRLSVVCLRIPPLRERPGDIDDLARFFAAKYSALFNRTALSVVSEEILAAMRTHTFEGNVRELENLVKRAILLGNYGQILDEIGRIARPADLRAAGAPAHESMRPMPPAPFDASGAGGPEPPLFATEPMPLKEVARRAVEDAERRAILGALSATSWNRRRAARLLQVSYRSLLYKIRDYAIVPGLLQVGADAHLLAQGTGPTLSTREGSC